MSLPLATSNSSCSGTTLLAESASHRSVQSTGQRASGRDSFAAPARVRWLWPGVIAMLVLYGALAWTGSWSKGLSFDEGLQLAVGYNLWVNDDFRIEGANGDLIKRWATLPFLASRPRFVARDDAYWKQSMAYELGHRFLFELGNSPEALLRQSRAMVAVLGMLTGLLVFLASRALFGVAGGLVSLGIFVLSPNLLAFGGIVSTDMSITLTLFAATCCIWRVLHEVTWPRTLLSLLATGLMVLAKPTALVILPITAVLVAVRLAADVPLAVRWRSHRWTMTGRWPQAGVIGIMVVLHFFAGWAAIWAHYGFRYTASPKPDDPTVVFFHQFKHDHVPAPLVKSLGWIEEKRLLPEGFHRGIMALLGNDDAMGSFMNGDWTIDGHPLFFPYAIWVKTPPSTLILVAAGLVLLWRARRHRIPITRQPETPARCSLLYGAAPHLALIGCYLAVAMTEDMNIGHRHVLPIYPALDVLAGAVALAWASGRWRLGVAGCLVWLAAESFAARPHYLAYFGPQAGGPKQGYQRLVDSSLDWGMDLPALKHWLDAHDPAQKQPLYLAYFGTDSVRHHGINARRLPGFFDRRNLEHYVLGPGHYAISVTLLQGVYTAAFGPWNREYEALYQAAAQNVAAFQATESDPAARAELFRRQPPDFWVQQIDLLDNLRFGRLCAWLRRSGPPPDEVGHTIFIWNLTYADLKAALVEPPVELADTPIAAVRQFRHFKVRAVSGG